MLRRVHVLESALKHGIERADVECAWCNCIRDVKQLERADASVHVRIGGDRIGRMIELMGYWNESEERWDVFHAMPPKKGLVDMVRREVGHAHKRRDGKSRRNGRA